MGSFSGLGIVLSFLFGFILMGLVAEVFYLLLWKKRQKAPTSNSKIHDFSSLLCWKKPTSLHINQEISNQEITISVRNPSEQQVDLEMGPSKQDWGLVKGSGEEGVEAELMRMHNLCGPPRFLFTIKEESKEDLESEDGKSRISGSIKGSRKSFSDVVFSVDGSSPFVTPFSSPNVRASILSDSYNNHGFNPLFESFADEEINRLRSSPPPKFKFLKDAEDKLIRKLLREQAERKRIQESAIRDSQNSRIESQEEKNPKSKSVLDKKSCLQ